MAIWTTAITIMRGDDKKLQKYDILSCRLQNSFSTFLKFRNWMGWYCGAWDIWENMYKVQSSDVAI